MINVHVALMVVCVVALKWRIKKERSLQKEVIENFMKI